MNDSRRKLYTDFGLFLFFLYFGVAFTILDKISHIRSDVAQPLILPVRIAFASIFYILGMWQGLRITKLHSAAFSTIWTDACWLLKYQIWKIGLALGAGVVVYFLLNYIENFGALCNWIADKRGAGTVFFSALMVYIWLNYQFPSKISPPWARSEEN